MKQNHSSLQKRPSPLSLGIAIYQLAGGLLGLGLFLKLIPQLQNPSTTTWAGIFLAALLYSFSIFCGFSLFQKTRRGYTFSIINQVLQVFSFGVGNVAYNYVAGLKIGLGIDFLTSWLFKFKLSLSSFNFNIGSATSFSFVSVNLLALLLLYLLERAREETK